MIYFLNAELHFINSELYCLNAELQFNTLIARSAGKRPDNKKKFLGLQSSARSQKQAKLHNNQF